MIEIPEVGPPVVPPPEGGVGGETGPKGLPAPGDVIAKSGQKLLLYFDVEAWLESGQIVLIVGENADQLPPEVKENKWLFNVSALKLFCKGLKQASIQMRGKFKENLIAAVMMEVSLKMSKVIAKLMKKQAKSFMEQGITTLVIGLAPMLVAGAGAASRRPPKTTAATSKATATKSTSAKPNTKPDAAFHTSTTTSKTTAAKPTATDPNAPAGRTFATDLHTYSLLATPFGQAAGYFYESDRKEIDAEMEGVRASKELAEKEHQSAKQSAKDLDPTELFRIITEWGRGFTKNWNIRGPG